MLRKLLPSIEGLTMGQSPITPAIKRKNSPKRYYLYIVLLLLICFTNVFGQAPSGSATSLVYGGGTSTSITLDSWTAPAGGATGYLVLINDANSFTAPSDGDEPTANTVWAAGGEQAVYFGTADNPSITVTSLSASTTYYIQIYAYNDVSTIETYETTGLNDNTTTCPGAPGAQATSFVFGGGSATTLDLSSWTAPAGGATGYVVKMNTVNSFTAPSDGDEPTAALAYGGGEQVVYFGTSASPAITVTGLTASTTYYVQVYSYNDCTGTETYETTGLNDNTTTCPGAPGAQATSFVFGGGSATTLDLSSWTAPAGGATGYVVKMNTVNSFTAPSDGDEPTATLAYGGGEQVVYFGTSASPAITVTGLTASTTYYVQVYSYNDCTGTETYETTGLNDNTTTCPGAPGAQATSFVFGGGSATTLDLSSWTAPAGGATGYVVKMNTVNSFTAPSDGDEPTATLAYGGGEQVVYFGTSASPAITVTGLTASTTYYVQVYSYNDCTGTETYETTGLNDNTTTNTLPVISLGSTSESTEYNTMLTFNAANGNLISIADGDGDNQDVTIVVTDGGDVTLASTIGLNFTTGNGTNDATVQFDGTLANVNTALDGLIFAPNTATATPTISISTNDGEDTDGPDVISIEISPAIVSTSLSSGNAYIDITFSEGIYDHTGASASDVSDWDINFTQNGGTATNVTLSDITNNSDASLSGGESIIRFVLNVTGLPDGNEFISITPNSGSDVADDEPNLMSASQTTGNITLNAVTPVTFSSVDVDQGNTYIDITFSEAVDRDAGSGTNPLRLSSSHELWYSYNDVNGTGATIGSVSLTETGGGALGTGGYSTVRFNFTVSGTPDGAETITFAPNDGAEIYSTASEVAMASTENIVANLTEKIPPTFVESYFFDTNNDGVIDEVVIEMNEAMDESVATNADFTLSTGTLSTNAVDAATANNDLDAADGDVYITFIISGYTQGTALGTTDLQYSESAGTFVDLAGNALSGNVDMSEVDFAAPYPSLSPSDEGTNHGLNDPLVLTFSETVNTADLGGNEIYIVRTDVFPNVATAIDISDATVVTFSSPTLTIIPEEPLIGSATYSIVIEEGSIVDLAASPNDFIGFSTNDDWNFSTEVDATAPNLTITRQDTALGDKDAGTSDTSVSFDLYFNEPIDDGTFDEINITIDISDLEIGGDATPSQTSDNVTGSVSLVNMGDDQNYSFIINNIAHVNSAADGTLSISIDGVDDLAGNTIAAAEVSNDFVFDHFAPTVTSLSMNAVGTTNTAYAKDGDEVTIAVVFDDDVNDTPSMSVKTGNAAINDVIVWDDQSDADATTWTATYDVSSTDTDGTLQYTLDFADDAGNTAATLVRAVGQSAGADDATTLTVDKTDPEITSIIRLTPTDERTNDDPVIFRVTFNEEVENVSADGTDFDVSGAATTGTITVVTQTANTVFDVSVAGVAGDGLLDLDIDGSADILDLADNNLGTINIEETYTIDNTEPSFNASTATAVDNVIDLNVNLDEAGKVHYLIVKRDADGIQSNTPTVADVTNQDGAYSTGAGGTYSADGEITVPSASIDYNVEETLDPNAVYDIYLVQEDESLGNQSLTVTEVTAIQTGGVLITAPTEAGICLEGDAIVLGDIILDEVLSTDFSGSTSNITLRLSLPTGFEFNTAVGAVNHAIGDINASSLDYISNEVVRVTFSMEDLADDEIDQLTISGLEIYGVGSTAYSTVTMERIGGTSSLYQAQESDDPVFATLSSIAPYDQMTITSTDPGIPYLEEITTHVANGNVVNDEVSLFINEDITGNYGTVTPLTIYAELTSDIVRIYSDEGLTTQVGGHYTGSTTYTPSLTDFGISAANLGINKFWIAIANASGCESLGTLYAIAIISDSRSNDATTLSESDTDGVDFQLSLPDSHNGVFGGVGLSDISYDDSDNNLAEVTFIPSNVGVGDYEIDYTLSENVDNISVTYSMAISVISAELVFNDSEVSFCEDETNIEVNDDDAGDYDIEPPIIANHVFYDVKIYEFKDGVKGISDVSAGLLSKSAIVNTGVAATDLSTGWIFDPSATHVDDQDTLIFSLEMRDTSNDALTEVATQEVIIYAVPTVTLDNDEDDTDTFDEYNCATDDPFDIYVTINSDLGESTEVISQGYTLIQDVDEDGFGDADDITTVFVNTVTSFDPSDPHGDASNATGLFRISYTTEGISDAGCANTATVDFQVFPQPARPTLSGLTGIGGLDGGGDYYLLEYGAGTTVADLISSVNDSVSWYSNSEKSVKIEVADLSGGETITAEELYGTSTPSGGTSKTFYFTDWTNLGLDPDEEFIGCESDVREVNAVVYSKPNAADIDLTGPFNGSVTEIGTNRYIFEYCNGQTLDDIDLTNDISDVRSYFFLLNEDQDDSTRFSTNTVSASDFGYAGTADTDTTIFIVHVQNDSTYTASGTAEFAGVYSDTTEVTFILHSIPAQPVIANFSDIGDDNTYKFCSGATLDEIETPNLTGYVYEWANDDGGGNADDGSIISTSTSDNSRATRAELGYSSTFSITGNKEVNTYHVRNYIGTNDESGFVGCPSANWTAVEVTVYPQPDAPFNSGAFSSNGTTGPDTYEYCQEQDISAENFDLDNVATSADGDTEYKWYSSNPDGLSLTPFFESTTSTVSFTTIQNRTDVDIDVDATTRIYVTQLTDALCESNSLPVDVIINRIPDVDIVDFGTSSFTDAYCNDNGDVILQGQVDGADYTGSDDSWSIDTGGLTEVSNLGEFHSNAAATAAGEVTTQGSATDHNVTYSFTISATSCSNAVTKTITVNPLPVVEFNSSNSDLDDTAYDGTLRICEDEEAIELTADVDGNGSGSFFVNGSTLTTNTNLEATFSVADFGEDIVAGQVSGDFVVSFEYSDENGCEYQVEKTIKIDDVPEISFDIIGGCESPAVVFESELVDPANSPYNLSDLSFSWAFFDSSGGDEGTDSGQDVAKTFVVPEGQDEEVFEAYVIATTTSAVTTIVGGCSTADDALTRQEVPVLISPTVAFVWDTVTVNEQTSFYVNEVLLGSDKIDSIALVFYHGADTLWYDVPQASEIAAGETSEAEILEDDEFAPFYYTYSSAGKYEVSVQMITENECNTTLIREVNIVPSIVVTSDNSYYQGFSNGTFDMDADGWYSETLLEDDVVLVSEDTDAALRASSWNWVELNPGDDTEKPSESDDWVWSTTAVDGTHYYQDEDSWLYSPSFDLSALTKPMMKFSAIYDFEDAKDGVVVQYSIDRGQRWQVLGGYSDGESTGIEWYNSENVGSDPGQQQSAANDDADQSVGWSGSENSVAWISARHSLDEIGYDDEGNSDADRLSHVRFRFAMASTSDTDKSANYGFAFDDFEILERSKGVVIEQFVSVSEDDIDGEINVPTATLQTSIDDILTTSNTSDDAIIVAYHTDLGFEDPFNVTNPAGPSARSIYYHVDDVTSILNGDTGGTSSSAKSGDLTWDQRDLELNALKDPGFEIIVTADPTATQFDIKASVEFVATENFEAGEQFRTYFVVLENSVAESIIVEGEELFNQFDHVVRKVLPDGSGEYVALESVLIAGESLPVGSDNLMHIDWELSNIDEDANLSAVIIIQNNTTKEIYQALSLDQTSAVISGKNSSSITDVAEGLQEPLNFKMYPNPTDHEVFITFGSSLSEDVSWMLYDQSGRSFESGKVMAGQKQLHLSTNQFPAGIYFLSMGSDRQKFQNKKLLIKH